jgi:hypothetical protein
MMDGEAKFPKGRIFFDVFVVLKTAICFVVKMKTMLEFALALVQLA